MRSAIALLTLTTFAYGQAPSNYYLAVNTSSPALLRSSLHGVIDDHTKISYTSGGVDTWNVLEAADQDPSKLKGPSSVFG